MCVVKALAILHIRAGLFEILLVVNAMSTVTHVHFYVCLVINRFESPFLLLGAQWLSGRVLDSRPRGRGYRALPASVRCVLEQDTLILA